MQVIEDSKGFTFSVGKNQLRAERSIRQLGEQTSEDKVVNTLVFSKLNAKTFSQADLTNSLLFMAEAHLQSLGHCQIEVRFGDQVLPFPTKECLTHLPEIEEDVQLVSELDRYDGPIAGFFEAARELYYFNWCMQAFENESELFRGPRFFYARQIPTSAAVEIRSWLKKYDESTDEEGSRLWETRPHWECYPISHVWSEAFDEKQDFAAIRIVYKDEGEE